MSLQRHVPLEERERIADLLEVSSRTVKRVIEGDPNVSSKTREAISAELERSGFVRGPEAVVGLVIPDLQNPFFVELADSLESRLAQHDMQLVIATSNDYGRRENQHIRWMIGMRASGVFYCQNPPFEDSLRMLAAASNLFVVLIDIAEDLGRDRVVADSKAGIERAVAHLAIENQHEKIGFLAGPEDSTTAKARKTAFFEAMDDHGLGDPPPLVLEGDYTFESGRHAALELAKRKRQGFDIPTAIVSANDLMAIGLIQGLGKIDAQALELRVPNQLSIVGFDNIATSTMITPELTSIDQRVDEIAERAVRMMIRRLDSVGDERDAPPRTERVTPELITRQSVSRCLSQGG